MENNNYKYYLIKDTTIVRTKTNRNNTTEKYVGNGKWMEVDYYKEVFSRLNGFDSSEDDWMYGIGDTDTMDSIKEISEEEKNYYMKNELFIRKDEDDSIMIEKNKTT